jgi:hypothetical protein
MPHAEREPGTGEIHYPFLFDWLDRLGYAGWIGCEYKPSAGTEEGLVRRHEAQGRAAYEHAAWRQGAKGHRPWPYDREKENAAACVLLYAAARFPVCGSMRFPLIWDFEGACPLEA